MPILPPAIALEQFTTFGDLLKYLRRRAGLTQRELSIAVGYSDTQISRLELNQRPPDLATIAALFIPALGLEHEPGIAARLMELASAIQRDDAPASGLPPFKGLQYFDEADADLFFGREALVAKLLERVLNFSPAPRFLGIVGASGSGKSSIVRAGLVPALRWSQASAHWPIRLLTPTARPLQALAARLTQEADSVTAAATLADDLARDLRSLHLYVGRLLSMGVGKPGRRGDRLPSHTRSPGPQLLLVVDQFEELFTLCRDEDERRAFIENLMTAALEPNGPTFVVLTLRADFYAHCAPYAALRDALAAQQEYIGPMSADELRRAIEEPAKRGGWELEPGLVEVLLKDVGADGAHAPEPGALPLLSHALLETWQRRRGRTLTVSGYLASGEVRGAIAETAEAVFQDELDAHQQVIARNIFLRLTELGDADGAAETRRRATFEELILQPEDAPAVRDVLTRLADARLIITDEGMAEVAHEALIREWPTLRGWLEENREGLRLHRHLTLAAEGWVRHGRDSGELYRGARLAQALEWAAAHPAELNRLEREFLEASQALVDQEAAEREAQRQRELEAAQQLVEAQTKVAKQLRRRALYLAGAFILALAMAGAALFFGEQARRSAVTALSEQRIAFARELAAAATSNLAIDPELSILLALQAVTETYAINNTALPEAEDALHRAVQGSRVELTLRGHTDIVWEATFSPDGTRLATASADGTAKIWNAATGEELLTLKGHDGGVASVAFSPDGKWLATGGADNAARVWDTATGQELLTLKGHTDIVVRVAFSPDARSARLATASVDGTAKVWNVVTGQELFILSGHTAIVGRVVFSPDGTRLATASDDGTAKVWDAVTGQVLLTLSGHAGSVFSVAFSPDGARLVTASVDRTAKVWDANDGKELFTLYGHADVLTYVAFSPDGTRLATASFDRQAKVWDAITGQELFTLAGHSDQVTSVTFSPDGAQIVTASEDGTAKVWNVAPSRELLTLVNGPASSSEAPAWLAYSPDGTRLVASNADPTPKMWDVATGQLLFKLVGHTDKVRGVAFSLGGTRIATASDDGTAKVWDASTGQTLLTLSGHTDQVFGVAFSPDGTRLATGSVDGTAKVWDAITSQDLLTLFGHSGPVVNVTFSPDGTHLATASFDGTAKVWDAVTGKERLTLTGHTDGIRLVTFSPDGTHLATASFDGTAKVWDAVTGKELLTLSGHAGTVFGVAFSPDGARLATASADRTAKVWDALTGQVLLTLYGHTVGVTNLAFSPDGLHLATASYDGTDRIYVLRLDELITLAQSRVTRSLTLEECQKYLHQAQCPQP